MTATPTAPPATSDSGNLRRWVVVILLGLGMIIAYTDRANISVALALPDFINYFSLSDTGRGVVLSSFFWSYAALQIPAGWVVDRYGAKIPYSISFAFWCVVAASTALARSFSHLLPLRIALGAGEALAAPASFRWIRYNFEEKERGLAVGLFMTGTKIGPAIGVPLAAWLVASHGWRPMFVILGLGGLLWLIPWWFLAKDTVRQEPKLTPAQEAKAAAPPIPFGQIMASPVVWGTVITTFCYMYFVYFCMTWMPAYFMEQRGLSLKDMGLYTFFTFGGMATVAALSGAAADWLIRRGGNPVTVRKGFTIVGFLIASTELIGAQSESVTVSLAFAIISLSGLGLATANYWALTQTLIPRSAIGRISGVQNTAASVAGIVAPIITGWLRQVTGSYEAPMQAIWLVLVVGVLSYLIMVKEKYAPEARAMRSATADVRHS